MRKVLDEIIEAVTNRLNEEKLIGANVTIKARVLSAQEAIGNPENYDFPILKGKEKIMEADFKGFKGQAFTDMYGGYKGPIEGVFKAKDCNNYRRALQVSTINALAKYWNLVNDTEHCKDRTPGICSLKICDFIQKEYPEVKNVTIVGFQPAIIDALSKKYTLRVLDLDIDNVGKEKFGVRIEDGARNKKDALSWAELVLATGSSLVNGTIDEIISCAKNKDKVIFYGISIAGASALLGLKRLCFT